MKSQKVYFSTFLLPSHLSTFRLFFFPLDSQRFKFCTFSCGSSAEKASGTKNKKSKSEKSKNILFDFSKLTYTPSYFLTFRLFKIKKPSYFSIFRNSKRNLSTFRLFVFRLFEIDFAYFPPGALQHIFPTQNLSPIKHPLNGPNCGEISDTIANDVERSNLRVEHGFITNKKGY